MTFLLSFLSLWSPFAILQLSHCSILLSFIFILLFSHAVAIAVLPLLFLLLRLPCRAVLGFSPPFYIVAAIFFAAVYFVAVQPDSAFHSRLDLSFVGLLFLLWSCHCHIHFAAKDAFVVTTGRCPVNSGCRFSHHCHAVIFSSLFLLSSIISYPRKNTRTRLPIFYRCVRYGESMAIVQLQCISGCGKSTIKVRRK